MKQSTPLIQRESEYQRGKRVDRWWTFVTMTLIGFGTVYFGLHIINYLLNQI